MCIYDLQIQCESSFAEVIPDEAEGAELTIEDMMSRVLLKLFDGGMVEEVKLRLLSNALFKRSSYSIYIRLLCPCQYCSLFPRTENNVSVEVQKYTYRVLKELFTSVAIASVTRLAIPWQAEDCYIY